MENNEENAFSPEEKVGDVWSMELCGDGFFRTGILPETGGGEQPTIFREERIQRMNNGGIYLPSKDQKKLPCPGGL